MRRPLPRHRSALIVAPHPDDETIGAWGLMRALRRRGAHVAVIVVSDGGASHPHSRRWPRDRLVRERRRETLRVMRGIGILRRAVRFLMLPDGALTVANCRRALRRGIGRAPALLIGPGAGDHHPDHRAVAGALAALRLPGTRRLAYPVWPAGPRRGCATTLPIGATAVAAKRAALRRYRTQCGLIDDAVAGFAMCHRELNAFAAPREAFVESRR